MHFYHVPWYSVGDMPMPFVWGLLGELPALLGQPEKVDHDEVLDAIRDAARKRGLKEPVR